MAMVVRSNLMALNANRQLGMNNSQVSKSLEKLSSGFRINRAGDDASGLAISEKMKAQIKGLEQASSNSQDGISLVQTAEGAMTEVHNMLNRMVELATKSANGTISDKVDRDAIQSEVDQLLEEIDRIGDATNFNGINLLDGSLGGGRKGAPSGVSATIGGAEVAVTDTPATKGSFALGAISQTGNAGAQATKVEVTYNDADGNEKKKEITFNSGTTAADTAKAFRDAVAADADLSALFDATGTAAAANDTKLVAKNAGTGQAAVTKIAVTAAGTDTVALAGGASGGTANAATESSKNMNLNNIGVGDSVTINGKTYTMAAATNADKREFGSYADLQAQAKTDGILIGAQGANTSIQFDPDATGTGLTLQVGDTNDNFNKVTVSVDDIRTNGLGVNGLKVNTEATAGDAIQTIKNAINKVSTNRGNLGALQNRLEYAINNLDVTAENMTNANSRIRDTDMAKEMMNYTKMNVLTQSAQAMLAQANQAPQSILQLLQ